MAMPPPTEVDDGEAPTSELLAGPVGDRCTNCQQTLASDQRYCVNCGTRRGKSRFSAESLAAQSAPAEAPEPPAHHRTRMSAATTLVAGVATLLLAMGVGVLIGHNSNSGPVRASAPAQIITVGSGGATGAASSGGGATAAAKKHGKGKKTKAVVVHLTAKTLQKASAAANKVFGNNSGALTSNPTQQVGGSCSGGAGCQGGKFTGNFFPGG
jgi:hypothetical protein